MRLPPVAAEQAGLVTRAQLLEAMTSRGAVDRVRRNGTLKPLARGVYTVEDLTTRSRRSQHLLTAQALLLSLGDPWCVARRTAAVLYGLPLLGAAPAEVQLTRPRTTATVRSSSRHRHINTLLESERTTYMGLGCTTLPRTVFDLARRESRRSAVVAADAALRSGLPREELTRVLDAHRGWVGTRQARWVLQFADGRAESPLESLGRVACVEEDLPVFEPQVEVYLHGELVARVDGLWREHLVVFEGDGAMKFAGPGVLPALLTRQERLRECGLPVVRATWADLGSRRRRWAEGVRAQFRERAGSLRPGVDLVTTRVRPTPLDTSDHYLWPDLDRLSTQHPSVATPQTPPARGVA